MDFLDTEAHFVALTKCTIKWIFWALKLTLLLSQSEQSKWIFWDTEAHIVATKCTIKADFLDT